MRFYFTTLFLIGYAINCFGQKQKDEPTTYRDDLTFAWKKNKDTLKLTAKSKIFAPIQIYFYSRKNNETLKSFLLKPKDSIDLLSHFENQQDSIFISQFNADIRIGYFLGHSSLINPDLDYPYRFPFKKGKKYEVSQSFNGKASHHDEKSRYAIDFQLNIGEFVYAARGGIVVKAIDWFTKKGGPELRNSANRIVILHDDGTLATYAHLDYKGVLVKEGQEVKKGQKIGVSGLTGHTRGPHLHFVVRKENDISIPIFFKGYKGKVLKKGKRYKVVN